MLINNIYESVIENIYNHQLCYFGQIKEITNDYNFFADTQISRFNKDLIETFVTAIEQMMSNDQYKLDFELMKSSNNKKTIELDIIAIYRKSVD